MQRQNDTVALSIPECVGLGSLYLFGLFLIVNGYVGIFGVFEDAGATRSWSIFAAVPILAISYFFGLCSTISA